MGKGVFGAVISYSNIPFTSTSIEGKPAKVWADEHPSLRYFGMEMAEIRAHLFFKVR